MLYVKDGESGRKLKRVLDAYNQYLKEQEPEVADTFDRVAIFPRPVGAKFLTSVFLKPERVDHADCLQADIQGYLERLVDLGLLQREGAGDESVYLIDAAWDAASDGLGAAQARGYRLLAIDLRNILADTELRGGNPDRAYELASQALDHARRPGCGYFRGQLEACARPCGRLRRGGFRRSQAPPESHRTAGHVQTAYDGSKAR
jgi:hypothetical protein